MRQHLSSLVLLIANPPTQILLRATGARKRSGQSQKQCGPFLAGKVDAATIIAQDGLRFAEDNLGPNDVATSQLDETLVVRF